MTVTLRTLWGHLLAVTAMVFLTSSAASAQAPAAKQVQVGAIIAGTRWQSAKWWSTARIPGVSQRATKVATCVVDPTLEFDDGRSISGEMLVLVQIRLHHA